MKIWTWIFVVLVSCGQKSELSVDQASKQVCDCFNSQTTGTFDEKLNPCMQEIADKKNDELNKAGIINQDTIKNRISQFSLDLMLDMTSTCDNYFVAINDMYDNGYSIDTTKTNRKFINELSTKIGTETNVDSVKALLHKKVHSLIKAREFDLALLSIDSIKSLDNHDYGANLASAYIFNQQGLHDKAVIEIDRAIEISGNESLKLYAEIAKQKKRSAKE